MKAPAHGLMLLVIALAASPLPAAGIPEPDIELDPMPGLSPQVELLLKMLVARQREGIAPVDGVAVLREHCTREQLLIMAAGREPFLGEPAATLLSELELAEAEVDTLVKAVPAEPTRPRRFGRSRDRVLEYFVLQKGKYRVRDWGPDKRDYLLPLIASNGQWGTPALVRMLRSHRDPALRIRVAGILRTDDARRVPVLIEALRADEDRNVRIAVGNHPRAPHVAL